jgi:Na+-translocating ferredoxin:NAD+ oxidoreductase RNF subunit RnfB
MLTGILIPVAIIGGMGIVLGIILGIAAVLFHVEQDPKIGQIRECLPGANCGGCGFAGCDALAEAIATGKSPVNGCPVGGAAAAEKIGAIMGVAAGESVKQTAFVMCNGSCDAAKDKYEYFGEKDCGLEASLNGGHKACSYGCLGDGSCVKACAFDAIHVVNGVAVVDKDKCVACGACVSTCPKHLIELVPYDNLIRVACSSHDMPKASKENCANACMGCSICAKNCQFDAVHIDKFLAKVDYSKCTQCGACTEKCPTKAIAKRA